MMFRTCSSLLVCATLTACAYTPPTLTNRLDIRQVPYTPDSGTVAIRCGKLLDGYTDTAQDNVLVVIRDGRIQKLMPGASRGDATRTHVPVLDLSGYTCLPGLIDMHTHLTDRPEDTADLTVYFSRPAEETLRLSKENAAATLLAGFTSVRNVGTYVLGEDTALRDQINAGKALGPRMQASGPYLTIPHGGGDLYIPDFKEPADNERFHAGVARDPEGFRERAEFLVDAIHNDRGYAKIRKALANQFDPGTREPDIQVTDVNFAGDRSLVLTHTVRNAIPLVEADARAVVQHISDLWGHRVELVGTDSEGGARLYAYDATPRS